MTAAMLFAKIYIVRHGQTEENRLRILQGQLDTQLNATGLAQAQEVALALKDTPFDVAYTSDLMRASVVRVWSPWIYGPQLLIVC